MTTVRSVVQPLWLSRVERVDAERFDGWLSTKIMCTIDSARPSLAATRLPSRKLAPGC
ncbi:hypothetical protein DFR67_107163 [Williamsia limnetica]|uniref:Uncharacterized protein n=1 Tax=Williamsia limnetica TaxID=882452 RepID=A0A318RHZ2_WILLI|nr:hypothetical protein DFR67_107163 [Williamsia limnetica]